MNVCKATHSKSRNNYILVIYNNIIKYKFHVFKNSDDDSVTFRGAVKKFQTLFNMPPEEKLVNCNYSIIRVLDIGRSTTINVLHTSM